MSKQFHYDLEMDLPVPPGCFPIIKVELAASHGSKTPKVSIFGYLKDATFADVEVKGPQERLQLPFNRPKIYIQHAKGLKKLNIETVGWTEPNC